MSSRPPALVQCQCLRTPGTDDDFSCADLASQEDLLCDGCRERQEGEGCVCVQMTFEVPGAGETHIMSTHASLADAFVTAAALTQAADVIISRAPP